jgi:hypothetical protein
MYRTLPSFLLVEKAATMAAEMKSTFQANSKDKQALKTF